MTDWLAYYEERRKFRRIMPRVNNAYREWLAFIDTTKEMQKVEGLAHKEAKRKLYALIEHHKHYVRKE